MVDPDNARNATTGSGISATEAQDILSVMQNMQSTLQEMDHRIRYWPVGASSPSIQQDIELRAERAHTTVPTPHNELTASDEQSLIGRSSLSLEGVKPETPHPGRQLPRSSASEWGFHHDEELTSEARIPRANSRTGEFAMPKSALDQDEHIRDLIRKELALVLAGAIAALATGADI